METLVYLAVGLLLRRRMQIKVGHTVRTQDNPQHMRVIEVSKGYSMCEWMQQVGPRIPFAIKTRGIFPNSLLQVVA